MSTPSKWLNLTSPWIIKETRTDKNRRRSGLARSHGLHLASAGLLFTNGQTTEKMMEALGRLGAALGYRVTVFPQRGRLVTRLAGSSEDERRILEAKPRP